MRSARARQHQKRPMCCCGIQSGGVINQNREIESPTGTRWDRAAAGSHQCAGPLSPCAATPSYTYILLHVDIDIHFDIYIPRLPFESCSNCEVQQSYSPIMLPNHEFHVRVGLARAPSIHTHTHTHTRTHTHADDTKRPHTHTHTHTHIYIYRNTCMYCTVTVLKAGAVAEDRG